MKRTFMGRLFCISLLVAGQLQSDASWAASADSMMQSRQGDPTFGAASIPAVAWSRDIKA